MRNKQRKYRLKRNTDSELQILKSLFDTLKTSEKSEGKSEGWFSKISANISKITGIVFTLIVITVLFSDVFQGDVIRVEPFLTSSEFQSKVCGNQMLGALIGRKISTIISDAKSVKQSQNISLPASTELPDVEMPGTNTSVKTIVRYIQAFPPFRYIRNSLELDPALITGEAFVLNDKITINVSITEGSRQKSVETFSGNIENIDPVITEIGEFILAEEEPYLLASYFYQSSRTNMALAQIQSCMYQCSGENLNFALVLQGLILTDRQEYEKAKANFEKIIENPAVTNRERAIAYNGLGLIFLDGNNAAEAISNFREAIRYDPENAGAQGNYAQALLKNGEYASAKAESLKALKLNPKLALIYYNLGTIYEEEAKCAGAVNEEKAKCLGKKLPEDVRKKIASEVIPLYIQAIRLNPNRADAYVRLARRLVEEDKPRKHENAIEELNKYIQINDKNALIFYTRGYIYYSKSKSSPNGRDKDLKMAVEDYKTAAGLYEQQEEMKAAAGIYEQLGDIYENIKDFASASVNRKKAETLTIEISKKEEAAAQERILIKMLRQTIRFFFPG